MDGVQRNFSMMAEKIDRMRCLRERCDNYVRLIKLTLDETIQEQNSLLNGSAIHNRLKHLGLIDKPCKPLSRNFNSDKIYSKNIDADNNYKYLVFDDHQGIRQHRKKTNLNDMDLSYNFNGYNSNYKLGGVRDYSSTYDDYNNPYYKPISSKNCSKTMAIRALDPQEYQVYYFPTSKPIPQYPRHTTERFYRRKPVKQYPVEEVPTWPTRDPKPVRVIEREPSYPIFDYDYHRTNGYSNVNSINIEPYKHKYHARYYPPSDMYHSFDDNNYFYESDLEQRPFSSITRPCSPVFSRESFYDRTYVENSGSLLENKIRDYVWNPKKDYIEKFTTPSYEKSTYYSDFKPSLNRHRGNELFKTRASFSFENQEQSRTNDAAKENLYRRNSMMIPQERNPSNENSFQSLGDDDHFSESTSYKKISEIHAPKRISFDLHDENIEVPSHTASIGDNFNENSIIKERNSMLERRKSTSIDDKHHIPLLPNDDYLIGKQRVISNDKNANSKRESLNKQEKLTLIKDLNESDKYSNLKDKPIGDDSNSFEKNVHSHNNDIKIDYDYSGDKQFSPNSKNSKNTSLIKDMISNENTHYALRRDSNDTEKSDLTRKNEKQNLRYQNQIEDIPNKIDKINIIERRDSYKNEQKSKINKNISGNQIKSKNKDSQIKKEHIYNHSNDLNDTSTNITNPIRVDANSSNNNLNKYNTNQQEADHFQKYISNNNEEEILNHSEKTVPYLVDNDYNKETDIVNSIQKDSSDYNTNINEPEPSQNNLTDDFQNNTDYYQDHYSDDLKKPLMHEYESHSESINDYVANDENYYTDADAVTNKIIPSDDIETVQQNEIIDENNVHDKYYFQDPTNDIKKNQSEVKYENQSQENEIVKHNPNDDYYYQNYSNADLKEQPENQFSELDHQGEYASEQNVHDDYYYQNHSEDTVKEQQRDLQYVEPDYQTQYDDQQATHDDYYYQNYDEKGPPENQYIESGNPGDYTTEQIHQDNYYNQNHSNENTIENQLEKHYNESEQPIGNYVDREQSNYYYNDNSNIPLSDQYDEHTQQESYVDNQQMKDNYYYEKHEGNYDESIPKEQYDGYDGEKHEANDSYYSNSQANNYDPHQNYENIYQTQPYDQNTNNENYDYSDKIDENKSVNQNPID